MGHTNILIDEKLISAARKTTGLKTKREIVDFALKALVHHQVIQEIKKFRRSGIWSGNLDDMRRARV